MTPNMRYKKWVPPDIDNSMQGRWLPIAAPDAHVRFWSKADMISCLRDVCFAPESGH